MEEADAVLGDPIPLTLLVDASSLIYRAFFSTPDSIKTPDGLSINAAHGFLNMLSRLVSDHDPDFLACASDEAWRPEWRVALIDTYKTHRTEGLRSDTAAVADIELEHQIPIAFELLRMCGVAVVGCPDYEAEDVIGVLAARAKDRVLVVSGDRDLFQLVRDPDVAVIYPKRGVSDVVVVDEAEVQARYRIPGRTYGDYAILRGDPSDGLPGVPGIGDKTAAALINRYGNLSAVVEAALTGDGAGALGKVRKALDYVDRATRVVLISDEAPIGEVDITRPRRVARDEVLAEAERFALEGPTRRLIDALEGGRSG